LLNNFGSYQILYIDSWRWLGCCGGRVESSNANMEGFGRR